MPVSLCLIRFVHSRDPRVTRLLFGGILFLPLLVSAPSHAQESILNDKPVTPSVTEEPVAIKPTVDERIGDGVLTPYLKKLVDLPPVIRDLELDWNTRSYYFNRNRFGSGRKEAFTLGGALRVRTGWLADHLKIAATLFTSQKLIGKQDRDGTLLLRPRQRSYTVLGEAYATIRYRDHAIVLYRHEIDLPYVNRRDNRMTPNTFEGYKATGKFAFLDDGDIEYGLGYLDKVKLRNANEFVSMSKAAGVDGASHGMFFGGVRISPLQNIHLGAINYYVEDTINIAYAELDYLHSFNDDFAIRTRAQFSHQRSVGDDLLTGSSFDTWVLGGRIAMSYRNFTLSAGFTTTDSEMKIQNPFGSYPGFVSLMRRNFNRAGEDAWQVGVAYDFSRLGLDGLSAFANYAEGYGARDSETRDSLPNEREFNITVDYKPDMGFLGGFWLRLRGAVVKTDQTSSDLRVIFNHELPVL
jgi:hypothetical protein